MTRKILSQFEDARRNIKLSAMYEFNINLALASYKRTTFGRAVTLKRGMAGQAPCVACPTFESTLRLHGLNPGRQLGQLVLHVRNTMPKREVHFVKKRPQNPWRYHAAAPPSRDFPKKTWC